MAYIILPAPGTPLGPCAGPCPHRDCARGRQDAALLCPLCEQPNGYEVPLTTDEESSALAHWQCVLKKHGY